MNKPAPMDEIKKAIIWNKWEKGHSMNVIARLINKPPATVFSYLRYHGGIQPYKRVRTTQNLTLEDREEISRGLAADLSIRSISRSLGRHASTISREIKKNGGSALYRASIANKNSWKRGKRPKQCLLTRNVKLKDLIVCKLTKNWSPEQISGWLKLTFPDNGSMRVSHETIYKSLFIQTRGLFRKQMRNHLRTKRKFRHAKNHKAGSASRILDGISICKRPAIVEDRAIPGHWEGDLICGSKNSYIATVVERQSRFTILVKVENKKTESVVSALIDQMSKLPLSLKKSLTWDRGTELAAHKNFSLATNMDVYFCDPSSPWQRGTNENTNGLLRQYFPKGHCLSVYSQNELDTIAEQLNSRPRKTLDFKTPTYKLQEVLR